MTTVEEPIIEYESPQVVGPTEASPGRRLALRVGVVALLLVFAGFITWYGLDLRRRQWIATDDLHYAGDVSSGFGWGHISRQVGLMNVYDLYASGRIVRFPNALDYTPLRLTIVTLWARWANTHYGPSSAWHDDYALTRPMLNANATAEFLSSVLIFFLIRMWIIRMDDAQRRELSLMNSPRPFRGVVRGMLGAMFFWFNPTVIIDGHGFPQWDVWNTPFFLAAALLACVDCWFIAGASVVIGAFLKGQILLVAPIFLIWPIVQLRFGAVIRFLCGFVFAGAMLAVYWLNATPQAIIWYTLMIAAIGCTWPFVMRYRIKWWMAPLAVAALLLAWPWKSAASVNLRVVPLAVVGAIALLRFAPPRVIPQLYALAAGLMLLMLIPMFSASNTWFTQGFEFGTKKLMWMGTQGTYSFPQFLVNTYRWGQNPNVLVQLPFAIPGIGDAVNFRNLMLSIYGVCLLLCGIGAAIHHRRNDTRFLVALVAPWLCWFVLLTQLNNRYLIWAAGLSGLMLGVSWGMSLLGVIVTVIGWTGIAQILHWGAGEPHLETKRILDTINTQMIWPLMLLAAIYLYVAVAPRRRRGALTT